MFPKRWREYFSQYVMQQAAINLSLYAHKFERQRCFKVLGCISMIISPPLAIDSLNTGAPSDKIQIFQITQRYSESRLYSKSISGSCSPSSVLHCVVEILVLSGSGYPVRNRSIAYNTEYTGNSYSFIINLGQCVDVEAGSGKAVGSAILRAESSVLLSISSIRSVPVACCKRRVGHNLVFLTVIYRELPTRYSKMAQSPVASEEINVTANWYLSGIISETT